MSSVKVRDTSQIELNLKEQGKLEGRYYTLQQKNDFLQCLFCCFCQSSNQFAVAQSDPNFSVSNKKGSIREQSDCISRVVCVCNRPFEAKLKLFSQQISVAERPCKFKFFNFRCWIQYMPCAQNQLVVTNKTGRVLGILRVECWCLSGNIFSCSDAKIQVLAGETEQLLYTVEGSYCQKSIFFPCCRCCYCPNIEYGIYDKMNLKVGKILNLYNGCFYECFTRTDKFGLQLPPKAESQEKILLLFAAMYLDYLRFETPYFCLGLR